MEYVRAVKDRRLTNQRVVNPYKLYVFCLMERELAMKQMI